MFASKTRFLLLIVHHLALLFAFISYILSSVVFLIGRSVDDARFKTRVPYSILLFLFVPDVTKFLIDTPILWLGSAFFIIRQMMTVAQALKNQAELKDFFPALLMSTFFFGALPSGPVFNGLDTWGQIKNNLKPDYGEGFFRLFEGFVYLFAIAGFIGLTIEFVELLEVHTAGRDNLLGTMLLKFVAEPLAGFGFLFATFYGYSRMAEGSARIFGFEVPQNFNKPHLARDLGDFWKRWHRSMADFVLQYIYLPLLVTTSRTKTALTAAFVFMGLWHNFSIGFLIWGFGHGLALSFALPSAKQRNISATMLRILSLAYVVFLSSIAHGVWSR